MKKISGIFLLILLFMNTVAPTVYAVEKDIEVQQSENQLPALEENNEIIPDSDKVSSSSSDSDEEDTSSSENFPESTEPENPDTTTENNESDSVDNQQTTSDLENNTKKESGKTVKNNAVPSSLTKGDITYEDLPGAEKPDKKGTYLLVPLRTGILSQPDEEQYIVEGKPINLSIKTTSWVNPLGTVKVDVIEWQQQSDGTWKNNGTIGQFKEKSGLLGSRKQSIDISIAGKKEGHYYYQLKTKLNTVPLLGIPFTYYSQLAEATVKKNPVSATTITTYSPDVVFEKAHYSSKAITNPRDATSIISWSSTLKDVEFSKTQGRNVDFSIENQMPDVNTDTRLPGVPFDISAVATNYDGSTVSDEDTIFVGGLVAKNVEENSGFSWEVYDQGLIDLNDAVESEDIWNYEWKYFDGKTAKSFSDSDGVKNYKGSLSNLTSLNEAGKILTFDKDSKFMKTAREMTDKGKPFALQVTFTTTVSTGGSNTETITIPSNKAQLLVSAPLGEIILKQVPSFNFGKIPANYIYEGTQDREPTAKGILEVEDSRTESGWQLFATMNQFQNEENKSLKNNINLKLSIPSGEINLIDNGSEEHIISSSNNESFEVTGKLFLQGDPFANIKLNEKFTSIITWNIVSSTPAPPPA